MKRSNCMGQLRNGLVFERSESMARLLGTTIILSHLLFSCTYHINITIMSEKRVKKISTSPYNYKPSKGLKLDSSSETIQDDSMSIKEMMERHVQGVLDPSEYKQGQYDSEETDVDSDMTHRQQVTELEALDYANEHGMTKEEVQAYLEDAHETFVPQEEVEPQETSKVAQTPLNDGE